MPDRFEHGGNLYEASASIGRSLDSLLDFSANINPLGVPPAVMQAVTENLPRIIHYPDAHSHGLKKAISQHYHVPAEQILPGNGAAELLYVLCHHMRPHRALIPVPAFSEYERAALAAGAAVDYCLTREEDGFALAVTSLLNKVARRSMVFVGNPNNPTGTLIRRDELLPLLAQAADLESLVIVDESFIDFLADDSSYTCRHLIRSFPNLVVLHSLTKFFAIPGLRLGFALADEKLCQTLHLCKDTWNVNSLAQAAGVAALGDEAYRQNARKFARETGQLFFRQLQSIPGIKPFPPSANFILLNITGTGFSAGKLRQSLAAQGILVRDCSNYPGLSEQYIRVAVRLQEQNETLIESLENVLAVK